MTVKSVCVCVMQGNMKNLVPIIFDLTNILMICVKKWIPFYIFPPTVEKLNMNE